MALIYEYMANGNLKNFLSGNLNRYAINFDVHLFLHDTDLSSTENVF